MSFIFDVCGSKKNGFNHGWDSSKPYVYLQLFNSCIEQYNSLDDDLHLVNIFWCGWIELHIQYIHGSFKCFHLTI